MSGSAGKHGKAAASRRTPEGEYKANNKCLLFVRLRANFALAVFNSAAGAVFGAMF